MKFLSKGQRNSRPRLVADDEATRMESPDEEVTSDIIILRMVSLDYFRYQEELYPRPVGTLTMQSSDSSS